MAAGGAAAHSNKLRCNTASVCATRTSSDIRTELCSLYAAEAAFSFFLRFSTVYIRWTWQSGGLRIFSLCLLFFIPAKSFILVTTYVGFNFNKQ